MNAPEVKPLAPVPRRMLAPRQWQVLRFLYESGKSNLQQIAGLADLPYPVIKNAALRHGWTRTKEPPEPDYTFKIFAKK